MGQAQNSATGLMRNYTGLRLNAEPLSMRASVGAVFKIQRLRLNLNRNVSFFKRNGHDMHTPPPPSSSSSTNHSSASSASLISFLNTPVFVVKLSELNRPFRNRRRGKMSVLEESSDVRMFNNAAFDTGGGLELEQCVEMKSLSESIEYDSSKENHNPLMSNSPVPLKTPAVTETTAFFGKNGDRNGRKKLKEATLRDEAMIDKEIEQIEMEMRGLSLKLESLERVKLEMKKVRIRERRCSIVPAKYMESNRKQSTNSKSSLLQKPQDSKLLNNRRGASLCPAEIYSAAKQSRRQSCFRNLGEINELEITKSRSVIGKSASVSPKPPRSTVPKFDPSKKAVTTIGLRKLVSKNDGVLSTVQPKKLFKESERSGTGPSGSASVKKPFKSGRVIPSRYNQSLPQTPDSIGTTKIRSLQESESRVKKRWEIPTKGNVVVYMSHDGENEDESDSKSTASVDQMGDVLGKIRTVRCASESPRDSGAVKRVADLVGKKSFFADYGQALSYVDEEEVAELDDENEAHN